MGVLYAQYHKQESIIMKGYEIQILLSKVLKIENDHLEKRAYAVRCCKKLAYIIYIILSFY